MYSRWLLIALRALFAGLGVVSPRSAGRLALRLFCTPRRHHRPSWETHLAARGTPLRVGPDLAAHSWGAGPAVLLMHGWEGRGTQLGQFVEPLVARGFRVVAIDGPAHGESAGTTTDLLESTEALRKIGRDIGPLAGVIAHSFGGAVTTLAIERGLDAAAVVLISAPSSIRDVVSRFGEMAGVHGAAMRAFREAIEARTRVPMTNVEIFERVAALQVPALIVHDRDDREVPFHDAERLSGRWPGASLLATSSLGHRRILKDPDVIARAVEFLAAQSLSACGNRAPLPRS